jgi:ATP-dependent Clp protease, protease subunit
MDRTYRLMQLLRHNQTKEKRYSIKQSGQTATIYLYDIVGWPGVSAETFVRDLNALAAATIHLRINSPGGDVFEGRAMATAIRQHRSRIIAHVDGVAASAASTVALAAREVEIAQGAFFMIHRAWALTGGTADELRAMAELLTTIDGTLADEYVRETGQKRAQILEWMVAETWFSAEDSVKFGFADRLAESEKAKNEWNLDVYERTPESLKSGAIATFSTHAERLRRVEQIEAQETDAQRRRKMAKLI